jgi:hypothetical protein
MRKSLSLAVAITAFVAGAQAFAQQPIDPYDAPAVAPAPPPPPPVPPPPPQPLDPYGAYPAPPAYGYEHPQAGPALPPSPPQYQQGYYLYAAPNQPPIYYAPPPVAYRPGCACCTCGQGCGYGAVRCNYAPRKKRGWDGVRRFSLGVHAGFLTLNQVVGSNNVTLGGAGFQLRLRSKGHFGFEMAQDFLHADYWNGNWQRNSYPFSLSLLFYVFPNSDARHFNLYAVGGVGMMTDVMTLRDETNTRVTQDFTEYTAHVGAGAELRFRWFAIEADARYMGLWRDNSVAPAVFYNNVGGAPVPKSSQGVSGNVYLSLWF